MSTIRMRAIIEANLLFGKGKLTPAQKKEWLDYKLGSSRRTKLHGSEGQITAMFSPIVKK